MEQLSLNEKQLQRSLYIARQKLRWRRWLIFSLMLVIAVSMAVLMNAIFSLSLTLGSADRIMQGIVRNDIDWARLHADNSPRDLELGKVTVLSLGNDRYDFTVEVYNPNENWALESIDYQFSAGAQVVAGSRTSLLPLERRLLTVLNHQLDGEGRRPDSVVLSSYRWRKFLQPYNDVWIFDQSPRYQARQVIGEGAARTIIPPQVTWRVTNNSGYNFLQTRWQVALYQGSSLVAVTETFREKVAAFESLSFSLNVFDAGARIDRVEVVPITDYFDDANRFLPQADPTFDRR